MENWDKAKVMSLKNDELLTYINHMLGLGYSLGKLNEEKGIRRQTVRDRLKKDGYAFDKNTNSFVKVSDEHKQQPVEAKAINKPPKVEQMTLQQLQERLEKLEKVVNALQVGDQLERINQINDLMRFNSREQQRNYPLHEEVIELLNEVHSNNRHLKVKDIVNHALYHGLTQLKHSDRIGEA